MEQTRVKAGHIELVQGSKYTNMYIETDALGMGTSTKDD